MRRKSATGISRAVWLLLLLPGLLAPVSAAAQSAASSLHVRIIAESIETSQLMGSLRAGISRQPGRVCAWYPIDVDDRMQIHFSKLNLDEIVINAELLAVAAEICLQAPGYAEYRVAVDGRQHIEARLSLRQTEPVN